MMGRGFRSPQVSNAVDLTSGGSLNSAAELGNIGRIGIPVSAIIADNIVVSAKAYAIDGSQVSAITTISGGVDGDFCSFMVLNASVTFVDSAGLDMGGSNVVVPANSGIYLYNVSGVWTKQGVVATSGAQIVAPVDEINIQPAVEMKWNTGSLVKQDGIISSAPQDITGPTIYLYSKNFIVKSTVTEINAVSGTFPDFTEIALFFEGVTTLKKNSTFEPPYGVDWVSKANDTMVLRWNERGDSLWRVQGYQRADGTGYVNTGGSFTNAGETMIDPNPTEITADAQSVAGKTEWKAGSGTPSELTQLAPPSDNLPKRIHITFEEARRIVSAGSGGSIPGVDGEIVLWGVPVGDFPAGSGLWLKWIPATTPGSAGIWYQDGIDPVY